MASTCLQLWQRCPSLLRSKTVDLALQYSTNVRHCPAALQNFINVPVVSSILLRSKTPPQTHPRWKLGVRTYCISHSKAQTTEAKDRNTDELSGVDIVPYKNPISRQLCDGGMPLKDRQTAFGMHATQAQTHNHDIHMLIYAFIICEIKSLAVFKLKSNLTLTRLSVDLDGAPRLSPFEEITDEEAVRIEVPSTLPSVSISLSDYVNESETLSKLVQLGNAMLGFDWIHICA